jgi:hypothetical protein
MIRLRKRRTTGQGITGYFLDNGYQIPASISKDVHSQKLQKERKNKREKSHRLKLDQDKKILYLINKKASLAFSSRRS